MVSFIESLLVQASVIIMSALGLNLLIGYAGVYSAAPAAFVGVGAYAAALIAIHATASIPLILLCSVAICAAASVVLGLIAVRVTGEYFIIASLALGFVMTTCFGHLSFLGGSEGLVGIPTGDVLGLAVVGNARFAVLAVVLVAISVAICHRLVSGPLGRQWRAVMNDERAARSLGKSPAQLRIVASLASGVFCGLAGTLFALSTQFVGASGFDANESFLFIVAIVIGGAGTTAGPVIGGLIIEGINGGLSLLNLPAKYAGTMQEVIYGLILIGVLVALPEGIWPPVARLSSRLLGRSPQPALAHATPVQIALDNLTQRTARISRRSEAPGIGGRRG